MTRVACIGGVGPIRVALWRMVYATAAAAAVAGVWAGRHGAVSAALGGIVNVVAGAVFAWVVARSNTRTAGEVLRTVIRAEVSKLALIVGQLWLVLVHYGSIVPLAFFGTFVLTVILFCTAILIRDG